MPEFDDARQLLSALCDHLDDWVFDARATAYDELFDERDPLLEEEALARLDRIDSRLSRERGEGLWGEDAYAIVPAGVIEEESAPHVVCTYYPQIPEWVPSGAPLVDEATRERLNDALWTYTERVVELVQARVEEYVWSSTVATWAE